MPKYKLEISESNSYIVEVEANSAEEAEQMYDDGLIDTCILGEQVYGENYVVEVTEVQNDK